MMWVRTLTVPTTSVMGGEWDTCVGMPVSRPIISTGRSLCLTQGVPTLRAFCRGAPLPCQREGRGVCENTYRPNYLCDRG